MEIGKRVIIFLFVFFLVFVSVTFYWYIYTLFPHICTHLSMYILAYAQSLSALCIYSVYSSHTYDIILYIIHTHLPTYSSSSAVCLSLSHLCLSETSLCFLYPSTSSPPFSLLNFVFSSFHSLTSVSLSPLSLTLLFLFFTFKLPFPFCFFP